MKSFISLKVHRTPGQKASFWSTETEHSKLCSAFLISPPPYKTWLLKGLLSREMFDVERKQLHVRVDSIHLSGVCFDNIWPWVWSWLPHVGFPLCPYKGSFSGCAAMCFFSHLHGSSWLSMLLRRVVQPELSTNGTTLKKKKNTNTNSTNMILLLKKKNMHNKSSQQC